MTSGNIEPQWSVDEYRNLKYNQDTVDDHYLNEYLDAGHSRDQMTIYNYFEPNVMPSSVAYIKSKFNYNNLTAAVNLIRPGQYLPRHNDIYARWKHIHQHADTKTIIRVIVMLESAEPGQILEVGDMTYANWRAGDWFSWMGSTSHAIYNMSLKDRYAIQLTGSL